jgi:HEAT repeat protein
VAKKGEIQKHIRHLLSDDFNSRAESVEELEKFGVDAAHALVDTLMRKGSQPHAVISLTEALEEIGKPSVEVLIHALGHITEIRKPDHAYLLENLIETLGRIQDRTIAAPLAQQLSKLNDAITRNHHRVLVDICEATKVRIHKILAELDDRAGYKDLLKMLGEGRRRVRDGVVQALARLGDRKALVPLLRLYAIEDDVSLSGASAIRGAFREIVRREKVREEDPLFRELTKNELSIFGKVYPRSKSGSVGKS